jgi:cell division protein FtsB
VLRWIALVLLVVLIALQVHLWVGQGGMRDLWRLHQRVQDQKGENAQLRKRNETLSAEVDDLKHGDEAIEERARAELGLVKPGEIFYQVVEPAAAADAQGEGNGRK